jgi:hypothetical protein
MGDNKSIPRKETHSAGVFKQMTDADVDCIALWGRPSVAVSVGDVGDLVVTDLNGDDVTLDLSDYPAGSRLDIQVRAVKVTGTECTQVIVYGTQKGG